MSDDRLELEALRAQLYDALKDIQLWGSFDPTNQERLYIYHMQLALDSWLRCVERRLSGVERRDEDQHCDEHPPQFLSLYQKASEVRGGAVGTHLGQLAQKVKVAGESALKVKAHLIRKVSQAPPPVKPVGGSWIPSVPTPAEIPIAFPPSFPPSLRLRKAGDPARLAATPHQGFAEGAMGTGKQRDQALPRNTREAVEQYATEVSSELHRFDSQFFDQFSDASDWQTQLALIETYCISRFDMMARQLLCLSVSPDAVAINPLYEECLNRVIREKVFPFFSSVLNPLRRDLREDVISRINLKLTAKKLAWLAEAKTAQLLRHSTVPVANIAEQKADFVKRNALAPTSDSEGRSKSKRGRPPDRMARNRQEAIRKVAGKGHKGEEYCDTLEKAGLSTSIAWQKNEGCPKSYLDAFNHANLALRKKWRNRIADEKYRATRKKPLV